MIICMVNRLTIMCMVNMRNLFFLLSYVNDIVLTSPKCQREPHMTFYSGPLILKLIQLFRPIFKAHQKQNQMNRQVTFVTDQTCPHVILVISAPLFFAPRRPGTGEYPRYLFLPLSLFSLLSLLSLSLSLSLSFSLSLYSANTVACLDEKASSLSVTYPSRGEGQRVQIFFGLEKSLSLTLSLSLSLSPRLSLSHNHIHADCRIYVCRVIGTRSFSLSLSSLSLPLSLSLNHILT